ncbi:helix-turn-helix domain-containing protein [Enterococcus sp. BWB1-3]|uniref:helix-turn-helix domain-containing protein n=1 Tax=Enterococcus sp. BWB1-3 TaxID=2787713 RepID=UPI0019231B63|nr:helix-turn-helix domain-containing protein [Enterococcus sp. BWB1-3]MBL1229301.1 helix-turn-helix domain-containing protein [Enterococcus sp. BWB1-3]
MKKKKENLVPLILLAQKGDKEALFTLFLRFESMIEAISEPRREHISEDCQQELALEFLKLIHKFKIAP